MSVGREVHREGAKAVKGRGEAAGSGILNAAGALATLEDGEALTGLAPRTWGNDEFWI